MKNTVEVINNLTDELANLSAKIGSLESFLVSKDYQELTCTQKGLLEEQHTAMKKYKETLLKRLVDLRYQEKREKEMTCEPTPEVINCASCRHYRKVTCNHGALKNENCWEAKDGTPAD